jgi:hypothetical protein
MHAHWADAVLSGEELLAESAQPDQLDDEGVRPA